MSQVAEPINVPAKAPLPPVRLAEMCPLTGNPRNYKVEIAKWGSYSRGKIVPQSAVLRVAGNGIAGNEQRLLDTLVNGRTLSETYEPVNVHITPPKSVKEADVSPDLVRESNTLSAKNRQLTDQLIDMSKDRDGWKAQVESRDKELGKQAMTIAELQATIAARDELLVKARSEVVKLQADLEAATAPKNDKTKTK